MSIQSQEDFLRFEEMCEKFYKSSGEETLNIDSILSKYFVNPNFLNEYKTILTYSQNSYVVAQVSTGLIKCVTSYWSSLTSAQKSEMKSTVWSYIESLPPLESFAHLLVFKLYSRILKFSWNEEQNKTFIIDQVQTLLKKSPEHHCIGLRILKDIIIEFNEYIGDHLTSLQHRNISISLRDSVLLDFFTTSLESLKFVLTDPNEKIRQYALDLSYSCLSFDFIKTTSIDSSEESPTVQAPSNWKVVFDNYSPLNLFFKIYNTYSSTRALECIVQIVSIRKSFFTEDEKTKFLSSIIQLTLEVLKNNTGFQEPNNHLVFSRIIERIKTNYHLNNLVSIPNYSDWIAGLSKFTIETLKNPQFSPNSIYYLLSLWNKLVSSIIYIKGDPDKTYLKVYNPPIVEAFIKSKIETTSFSDEEDEYLMDYEKMVEILENIPHMCRLTYQATCTQIISMFDRISQLFSLETNPTQLEIYERQCAWLIYIIGCLIHGRTSINSSDEHDKIDGDLSVRVFVLIGISDKKLSTEQTTSYINRTSRIALELSFIYFMQNFRRIYIGENSISSTKIYQQISELSGPTDHTSVLFSMIQKIGFNFKYWAQVDDIIKRSLDIFWESVNGHSTSKILLDNAITKEILKTHGSEVFPFLEKNPNPKNRTILYRILGKLLFTDENIILFDDFITPFDKTLNYLLDIDSLEVFRDEKIKKMVIGLVRDLRGLVTSALTKRAYTLIFDWINPKLSKVLLKVIEVWIDTPEVTSSVLGFISEYVFNRQSRLIFDNSCPSGFVVFKETSKVLVTYGQLILNVSNIASKDLYKYKIKGLQICMTIFTRCLVGNYCNFGVFELYGDNSFTNAIDTLFKLILSVSMDEMVNYPKALKIYIVLLENLCQGHAQTIVDLNSVFFNHIMMSLHKCLDSQDVTITTSSCNSIERILLFSYQQLKKKTSNLHKSIHSNLISNPNILYQIIDKTISVILYGDNYHQYGFSKVLLTCIIFNRDILGQVKQKYIQLYSNQQIDKIFGSLMNDIQDNLETKNKDKFNTNVLTFKKEMKDIINSSGRFYYKI